LRDILSRYWPLVAGVVSTFGGIIAYRMRAKIDVWRMTKQADMTALQTPLSVMQQAIQTRDKMLETANAQLYAFVTSHLADDRLERDKLIGVLTKIEAAMVDLARDQRQLREESSKRSAQNHEDLRDISTRLVAIEVKVGLRSGA
jgi:hypothetical protein